MVFGWNLCIGSAFGSAIRVQSRTVERDGHNPFEPGESFAKSLQVSSKEKWVFAAGWVCEWSFLESWCYCQPPACLVSLALDRSGLVVSLRTLLIHFHFGVGPESLSFTHCVLSLRACFLMSL